MESEIQNRKSLKVLAVSALLLSLGSFVDWSWALKRHYSQVLCQKETLSEFTSLLALAGVVLGLISFKTSGNRAIATMAIVFGMPALLLTLSNFLGVRSLELGRETAAIQVLRTIHNNQAQFQAIKNRFGTAEELVGVGLIDEMFKTEQPLSGYVYSFSDVTSETYCAQAMRLAARCGKRDFIVCEDGDIRFAESETPVRLKRGEGQLLSSTAP